MATVPASQIEDAESGAEVRAGFVGRERAIAYGILIIAIAFSAVSLLPEGTIHVPPLNDNVLHLLAAKQTASAWSDGKNPTDPWLPQISFGFPLAHHYQHLEYLPVAGLHLLFQRALSIDAIVAWSTILLLSLFPLSVYYAMRQFGFGYLTAAFAGMAAPLVATNGLYGIDFGSYVWRGYGLYTQLWGMFLLPLALAAGYRLLRAGKGYFVATLLLTVTMICHTVYGYMAVGSLGFIAVLLIFEEGRTEVWLAVRRTVSRLLLLIGLTGLSGSYFFIPFLLDQAFMNRSVWELPTKYNSFGAPWVLKTFAKGDLFDYGRLPVLTLLVIVGLIVCAVRWRVPRYRLPVILFGAWLALYFGRPTWGPLLDLMPLSSALHFHRLIGGVHFGGLLLIGVALAAPWPWLVKQRGLFPVVGAAFLCVLLLFPAFHERSSYLSQNATWMQESHDAIAAEQPQLNALFDTLRTLPPGRVYAGLAGTWGSSYRVGAIPMYALLQDQGFDMLGYLYAPFSLNSDIQVLFDERRQDEYNLFNVRYVVAPVGRSFPSFVRPIGTFGNNRLFQVDTTGYFDVVQPTITLVGDKSDFYQAASSWLAGPEPGLKQEPRLILDGSGHGNAAVVPLALSAPAISRSMTDAITPTGNITSEQVGKNGSYAATVEVKSASMVMAKVTFHPGWRVTVDGTTVKPVMLMPSFVGIPVTPGTHRIQMTYQASRLRLILELLGVLTLTLIALAEWRWDQVNRKWKLLTTRMPFATPAPSTRSATQAKKASAIEPDGPVATDPSQASITAVSTSRVDQLIRPLVAHRPAMRPTPGNLNLPKSQSRSSAVTTRTKVGIYLLFLTVYLFTGSGHFYSTDHVAVYLTTQSMVEHHSLAIKPIARAVQGRGGAYYGRYGLLQSVVSIPLYLIGSGVDHVASPSTRAMFAGPNIGDWGGTVPIFFVSLLNAFITPLTCLLVFLFTLRLGLGLRTAYIVMFLFGFSTLAWTYAHDYFQHPLEALLLLLTIYMLFVNRERLSMTTAVAAGVPLGMAILARLNIALIVPVITVYVFFLASGWDGHSDSDVELGGGLISRLAARIHRPFEGIPIADWWSITAVRSVIGFLIFPTLSFVSYLALNYYRFGTVRDPAVNNIVHGSLDILVGLYGNLLSPGRSVFLYSPPLILALIAFGQFYRRFRAEALLIAGISLTYLLLYSIPLDWDGGWSWGPRYLLAVVPLLMLPLGFFLTSRTRIVIAALVGVIGAAIEILGVAINVSYVYWDWVNMRLTPDTAYLFVPAISAIPTHARDLVAGKHIDMWLVWVGQQFGIGAVAGLVTIGVTILFTGLFLLLDGNPEASQPQVPQRSTITS